MRLARLLRPGVRGLQMGFIRARALVRMLACPRTMRELAADLATDAPYTTVVVDDLERRELVQRIAHPQDRRVKMVPIARRRRPGDAEPDSRTAGTSRELKRSGHRCRGVKTRH